LDRIGSESAKFIGIFNHYGISKLGIAAYNEALRQELNLLGMTSILIQPGAHETPLLDYSKNEVMTEEGRFERELEILNRITVKKTKRAKDPINVANVILKALNDKSPRAVYRVNNDPELTVGSFLPRKVKDWLVRRILKN